MSSSSKELECMACGKKTTRPVMIEIIWNNVEEQFQVCPDCAKKKDIRKQLASIAQDEEEQDWE